MHVIGRIWGRTSSSLIDNKRMLNMVFCIKISSGTIAIFANRRFDRIFWSLKSQVTHTGANATSVQSCLIWDCVMMQLLPRVSRVD